jgi:hypothetical protein
VKSLPKSPSKYPSLSLNPKGAIALVFSFIIKPRKAYVTDSLCEVFENITTSYKKEQSQF